MAARGAVKRLNEIFVSRLPWTAGTAELRDYFTQFGNIKNCRLTYDQKTGFSKGFAFVAFRSEEGLENALRKEQHQIDGHKIAVQRRQDMASVNKLQIRDVFNADSGN